MRVQIPNLKSQEQPDIATLTSLKPSLGKDEARRGSVGAMSPRLESTKVRAARGFEIWNSENHGEEGRPLTRCGVRSAFTLLEVLIATAIFATVLIAMNTVFFGALRLQRTTTRIVEEAIPINHALSVMKADLRSTLAPGGVFAGQIIGGRSSSSLGGLSTRSSGSSGGSKNDVSTLQVYTTSGVVDDSTDVSLLNNNPQPWSETQKIAYYLRDPLYSTNLLGKELVRAVTRNLLALTEEIPSEEPLLDGVEDIGFLFYDGSSWRESWDSSTDTNTVPQAIKVQIEFASEYRDNRLRKPPIEFVVPIVTQARTNQVSGSGATGQTNAVPAGAGGGNNSPGGGLPAGSPQPGGGGGPGRGGTGQRSGGGR